KLEESMEQVRVTVCALDPITRAGLTNCLESLSEVTVAASRSADEIDVVVAAFDRLTSNTVAMLRTTANEVAKPIVLVIDDIKEAELLTAVECRVVAILPRTAVTDDRLLHGIRAAASGGADIPPNLLGQLLAHTERLHREVLAPNGLT